MARDRAAPCNQGNGPGLWGPLLCKGTAGELTGGTAGEVSWHWARRLGAAPRRVRGSRWPSSGRRRCPPRWSPGLYRMTAVGWGEPAPDGLSRWARAADTAGHRDHDGGALVLGCAPGSAGGHRRLQRRPGEPSFQDPGHNERARGPSSLREGQDWSNSMTTLMSSGVRYSACWACSGQERRVICGSSHAGLAAASTFAAR